MALAGDHHVVVAVDAQLDGALQLECGQSSALAEDAGIAFLAAKATAHAAANHFNVVGAEVQCRCGFTLIAIGVLRRTVQGELTIFTRHGVSNLAFHVKLFLLTGFGTALHSARCFGNGFGCIATRDAFGRHDKTLCRHGFVNGQNGLEFFDQHFGVVRSFAGVQHVASHHHRHGLTQKLYFANGQERIVMDDRAAVVFSRNVFGGVHGYNAVGFQNGVAVNTVANQFAMGHWGLDDGGIQGASQLGHVVGKRCATGDVQMRRLMNDIGALLQPRHGQ